LSSGTNEDDAFSEPGDRTTMSYVLQLRMPESCTSAEVLLTERIEDMALED